MLEGIDWTVEPGRVVGLVGPSGGGKTTLLRIIAGLEDCSTGRVVIGGNDSTGAGRRPTVGMVFQNLALWPHLTARRQVEYVLGSLPRNQRRERAAAALAETGFPAAAWDRRPAELSGGEAQRLALARALADRPGILLLDEPLARVDAMLRDELLDLIGEVIAARGTTALFVTHHAAEAMILSDEIAVMRAGRIEMHGSPEETFWNAPSLEIARLTGPLVRLPRCCFADKLIGRGQGPVGGDQPEWADSESVFVRPQQLRFVEAQDKNRWEPVECRPDGAGWRLVLACGSREVAVHAPRPVQPGQPVGIEVQPRPCR